VIDYEVYNRRPSDADLLIPAIEAHQAELGRPPRLGAADAPLLSRQEQRGSKGEGRQARVHSQSLQQKPRATVTPAGIALRLSIDRRSLKRNFAASIGSQKTDARDALPSKCLRYERLGPARAP
jgi:hypothetical protein